jgi:hypothetical protein
MCIKLCSRGIAQVLKSSSGSTDDISTLAGADDFLPMMILALKEANPDQLHSNIKYIQVHYFSLIPHIYQIYYKFVFFSSTQILVS